MTPKISRVIDEPARDIEGNSGNSGAKSVPDRSLSYDALASLSDEALMSHLKNGHHDSLAVLFDRYHRLVLNVALRILRDPSEAEDLMQSVFLEILRSAAQFSEEKGTAKIWMLQYVYHRSFNRRRDLTLRGFYRDQQDCPSGEGGDVSSSDPNNRGAHALGVLESARTIEEALGNLNKKQRRTLELSFFEGLTIREVSERTCESFDAVRHHYYRGLEKLRLILREVPHSRTETSVAENISHVRP